jgi:hypothetical protein
MSSMDPVQTLSPQQAAVVNWALRGESAFVTGSAGTGHDRAASKKSPLSIDRLSINRLIP